MQINAKYTGTITITNGNLTNTATINAVVVAKSDLSHHGQRESTGAGTMNDLLCTLELTNTTTITATRGSSTDDTSINYQLIETA